MTIDQRTAHARWLLERQLAWISSADTKAAGLAAAYVAVAAVAATLLGESQPLMAEIMLLALAATLSIVGMVFALIVFMPHVEAPHKSLIYFGGIASTEVDRFLPAMSELTEEQVLADLLRQVHVNAMIATAKHNSVQTSVRIGAIAILLWLVVITVTTLYPGGVGP